MWMKQYRSCSSGLGESVEDMKPQMPKRWRVVVVMLIAATVGALPSFAATDEVEQPVVLAPLDDIALFVDGAPRLVNLVGVFGNRLTDCVVESSDEGVVKVSLTGFKMLVTPVGVGDATITITASNSAGSVATTVSVGVGDRPPVAVGTLPDATLTVGDALEVDIAAAFSGTNLVYSVMSSAEETAAATLSGTTVTLAALAAGEGSVMVTATNSGGTATQTFSVTVKDQPAVAVGTLADITLTAGDALEVDIAASFSGTNLVYSVMSSAEEIAAATLSGTTVTLAALAAGEGLVTVTATNTAGSATQTFSVTVKDQPAVAVGTLADATLTVGDSVDLEISESFSGTNLVYSVMSSAEEIAAATLSGTTVTLAALAAGEGSVTVTATNSEGTATQTFSVTVKDQPAVAVGTLADATLTVGDSVDLEISESFSGTNLVYSVMSSAEETATATLSGTTVTLAALVAGEGSVTVTATNSGGTATQTFSVTVKDQPPVAVGTLADITLTAGDALEVDISAAFSGTNLVYSVMSSAEETAAATLSGTTVTLVALVAGEGSVTVTATNGEGAATQTFAVAVKDQPPVAVGTLAAATLTVGDSVDLEISESFSGTNLVYSVMSSAEETATATLSGTTVTLAALAAGEGSVTVTATNGEGAATQTFAVAVKDQPPVAVGTLAAATLTVGDSVDLEISESFSGTNLVHSVMSSAEETATATLSGTTVTLAALAAGEGAVTVTATNGGGAATQTFAVAVKDQPPVAVGTLADATLTVGDSVDLEISESFSGTNLVYSVMSSAEETAAATLSGTTVTLAALVAGEGSVTVTAANSGGTATQTFSVTVKDQPPVAVGTLADATLTVGDALEVDIAASFSGSALVYSVMSSAEEVATATLSGTTVTLAALVAGEGSVTVTATNGEGAATQTFAVAVKDQPPVAVGTLADATLTVGDALEVDIAASFSGSALVYSVMSSSEGLASTTLTGTVATVSALAAGSVTVTVTAENSAGSATQMFLVSVEDQLPTAIGSLSDVRLTAGGESVSVDVSGSFGGTALVYSVARSGDAVSVSLAGTQLAVVPLVEGEATVTVTATNSAGSATQTFRATVSTDAAESSALQKGFAAIGASTLSSVSSAIGARFGDARGAMPMPAASAWQGQRGAFGLAPDFTRGHAYNGWGGGDDWESVHGMPGLLPGTFAVPLNAAAGQDVKWQRPARWTIWGHSDRQSFEGAGYDGGLTSVYLGADADFGEAWLAGFAVSRSVGDADYEFTSARANGTGNIETEMLSVYPYVHWSLGDAAEMWAIVGVGWGDARHSRSATAQQGSADLSMRMASLGGRRTLASRDAWDLSLLGDASLLDLQTDGGVGIIDDMEVGISRVRAGLEAARNVALDGGGLLTWFGQIAARHDGGDGETGGGAELTGGFRYDSSGRLRLAAKARVLGMHAADDYEERGFSISAMVRPGPDGAGMSLSLASHSGAGMAGTGRSLVRGYGQPGDHALRGREDWSVDARLGYTILNHRLSALLTPFAEVDVAGDSRHAMMGVQYDFAGRGLFDRLNVELAGGRGYHHSRRASGNLVELRGEMRF